MPGAFRHVTIPLHFHIKSKELIFLKIQADTTARECHLRMTLNNRRSKLPKKLPCVAAVVERPHRCIQVDAIPSQLESKLNPLLEGELNRYGLLLQQSPVGGKGVFSTKTIPEGECIMEATCLFFTDIRLLLDFVRKSPSMQMHV